MQKDYVFCNCQLYAIGNKVDMIQLYKYVNNKYDTNFVLQLQYKSMLEKRY